MDLHCHVMYGVQAAQEPALSLIKYLLEQGAPLFCGDASSKGRDQDTPLSEAYGSQLTKIRDLIFAHIGSSNEALQMEQFRLALRMRHVGLSRMFLSLPGLPSKLREMDFYQEELHPGALFLLLDPTVRPGNFADFYDLYSTKADQVEKEWSGWQNYARDELDHTILEAALASGEEDIIIVVAGQALDKVHDPAALDGFFGATRTYTDPKFWRRALAGTDDEWFEFSSLDYTLQSHDLPLRLQKTFQRLAESTIRVGNLPALQQKLEYLISHADWTTGMPELTKSYDDMVLKLLSSTLAEPRPPCSHEAFKAIVQVHKVRHIIEPWLLERQVGDGPLSPTVAHLLAHRGAVDNLGHLLGLEPNAALALPVMAPRQLDGYDEPLTPMGIALIRGHAEVRPSYSRPPVVAVSLYDV